MQVVKSWSKKPRAILCLCGIILFFNFSSIAQSESASTYDAVNKPVHDYVLSNIRYYPIKEAPIKSLLKRPLIIDFFSTGCTACFESFPKLNALQQEFGDSIQFMLVGREDGKLQNIYEHYRISKRLNLSVAFDSITFNEAVPNAVPYILWIGKDGVVKAITNSEDLTDQNVRKLARGEGFRFFDRSYSKIFRERELLDSMDKTTKLSVEDSSLVVQSLLRKLPEFLAPYMPSSVDEWMRYESSRKFHLHSLSTILLYKYAYAGTPNLRADDSLYSKFYITPVLETRDSTKLLSELHDHTNVYEYSVVIPESANPGKRIRERMKEDLKQAFGYDVSIEQRKINCLKLVALPSASQKLRNNQFNSSHTDFSFYHVALNDVPISDITNTLLKFLGNKEVILNETGIRQLVDIELNITFDDMAGIVKELNKNGLDLIAGTSEMDVIVIRDPTSQTF